LILIADLGATNARFCITRDNETYTSQANYPIKKYDSLEKLCLKYFSDHALESVERAVIGVAAPIIGDQVSFVNTDLKFSILELEKNLFKKGLIIVNDLELQGHAIFNLKPEDLSYIGGKCLNDGTKILVAPGTGLGLAGIEGSSVIATEAGHINIADKNDISELKEIIDNFILEKGRNPNYEDFLSGKGIIFFHKSLSGLSDETLTSEEILKRRNDEDCVKTIKLMNYLLSSYLKHMALVWGASGGVLISGSIINSLLNEEDYSEFRKNFEDSDTMKHFLSEIPLAVVKIKDIGFAGGLELSKKFN